MVQRLVTCAEERKVEGSSPTVSSTQTPKAHCSTARAPKLRIVTASHCPQLSLSLSLPLSLAIVKAKNDEIIDHSSALNRFVFSYSGIFPSSAARASKSPVTLLRLLAGAGSADSKNSAVSPRRRHNGPFKCLSTGLASRRRPHYHVTVASNNRRGWEN